jgi:hypothetical protein
MTDAQLRVFMALLMCSDPWPLEHSTRDVMVGLANEEAERRGFDDWIEAYHQLPAPSAG